MVIKKILTALMVLSISLLTACGTQTIDYGNIEETEVTDYVIEKQEELFKELDNLFEYKEWNTYELGIIDSTVSFPSSWNVKIINARNYQIEIPESDPYLPKASLNLVLHYDDFNVFTNTPQKYDEIFQKEAKGLLYKIGDYQYYEMEEEPRATEMYTEDLFTDQQQLLSVIVYENAAIGEEMGFKGGLEENYSILHYNVCFKENAMQFRWCFPTSKMETAKKMATQIVSTLKDGCPNNVKTKEITLGDYTFDLPDTFVESVENKIYKSTTIINSQHSGMMIGAFPVKINIEKYYEDKEFIDTYLKAMATAFSDKYEIILPVDLTDIIPIHINGQQGYFLQTSIFYNSLPGNNTEGSFLGVSTNVHVIMYVLPSSTDEHDIIAVFTLPSQVMGTFDIMDRINKALNVTE